MRSDPRRAAQLIRACPWFLLLLLPVLAVLAPPQGQAAGPAAGIELKLPADIIYRPKTGTDSAVVFSHQSHAGYADNHCTTCHPQPFTMLKRGPDPTHAQMNAGRSCGICHDGQKAHDVKDTASCSNCHTGVPAASAAGAGAKASGAAGSGGAAARKLPDPHTYPPSEASPGQVTFRHQTHLQGAGHCAACHPKLFTMAPAAPIANGGMHEPTACGACHNGAKAFATDNDAACERCHHPTGAQK
jgi:c(7)-type cytochrome triheme protein